MTEFDEAVSDLLEDAEDLTDAQRLQAIAGLADGINTNPLPDDQAERVIRWRSQARSAATSAESVDGE